MNMTNIHQSIPRRGAFDSKAFVAPYEKGISLVIVLIALVLMSLAAVGLVRMVDTGTLVIGNLAFKQATTSSTDREVARAAAALAGINTDEDNAGLSYYATSYLALDVSGKSSDANKVLIDWAGNDCAGTSNTGCLDPTEEDDTGDYKTRYLVTRMCRTAGAVGAAGNSCLRPIVATSSPPADRTGGGGYGGGSIRPGTEAGPLFRVIVRSVGPRNSISYTETYIHF
jgi:type IV pilus assembly protein PilX